MLRLFLAVTILGLFLFNPLAMQTAQAQAQTHMSIYAENDNFPLPPTDWYTPCCSRAGWTFKFWRTDTPSELNSVTFSIEGLGILRVYGQDVGYGWHTYSGTEVVDPRFQHRLFIGVFSPGHDVFRYMSNDVRYWDDKPSQPPPGP